MELKAVERERNCLMGKSQKIPPALSHLRNKIEFFLFLVFLLLQKIMPYYDTLKCFSVVSVIDDLVSDRR